MRHIHVAKALQVSWWNGDGIAQFGGLGSDTLSVGG